MNVTENVNIEYLKQDYENPKYIFHGAREVYDVLKKSKAHDSDGDRMNEQNAVFGSSIFAGAVPYAIKGKGRYNCRIGYYPDDLIMEIYNGVIPEDDFGYVYVCDASSFDRCGDTCQYVSYTDVTPIEIIKIYYKDYMECFEYVDLDEVYKRSK